MLLSKFPDRPPTRAVGTDPLGGLGRGLIRDQAKAFKAGERLLNGKVCQTYCDSFKRLSRTYELETWPTVTVRIDHIGRRCLHDFVVRNLFVKKNAEAE